MIDSCGWRADPARMVSAARVRNDEYPTDRASRAVAIGMLGTRGGAPDRPLQPARDALHREGRSRAAREAARLRARRAYLPRRLSAILPRDGLAPRARGRRRPDSGLGRDPR